MSAPTPATGAPPATPQPDPPSLRRRAPARLDLMLRSGRCPDMMHRRVHLLAGRTLQVQVVPQNAATKVEIVVEQPLWVVMPVSRIEGGPAPTYYAEYTGRSPFRIPLPTTGKLHVSLSDGFPNPVRVTIPVTVWPSAWTLFLWWVVVFLSLVGARWQGRIAQGESVRDFFPRVRDDLPYLGELMSVGVLAVAVLRVVGWVITLVEPGGSDDQ